MVVALIKEREREGATPPRYCPLPEAQVSAARNPMRLPTTAPGPVTISPVRLELSGSLNFAMHSE